MRLGDHLHVRTSRSGERYWNLLNINWGDFSHNEDIDADAINIEPEIGEEKVDSEDQGTTIRISALQNDWEVTRFKDMFRSRIARMIDPFESGLANRLIIAKHNGKEGLDTPGSTRLFFRQHMRFVILNFVWRARNRFSQVKSITGIGIENSRLMSGALIYIL